jgi:membrane associated rhomboid family serine protease
MVTSLFVHAGISHIIVNMITLFFFGSYLVRLVGEGRFLGVYFIGGIIGNAFYILLGSAFSVSRSFGSHFRPRRSAGSDDEFSLWKSPSLYNSSP